MDYHELKVMTVAQLRGVASGVEGLTGYTQMNKDHLLLAICEKLNIDAHEHRVVMGVDKSKIKTQIKELKARRDAALEAHDHGELKMVRRRIHHLKRRLHKAMVQPNP